MSPRSIQLFTAMIGLGIACSSPTAPTGPLPGKIPPGQACTVPNDCGCWQCNCAGVGGQPGSAQRCVMGECPSGEDACAPSCAAADAGVTSATPMTTCIGIP